jgi:DNA-binding response OmpR family regulator
MIAALPRSPRRDRILLLLFEEPIVERLSLQLSSEGYQVSTLLPLSPEASLEQVFQENANLIILPGSAEGLRVCGLLRRKAPNLPILLAIAADTLEARIAGLDVGADDFMVPPFHTKELLHRVRCQLKRVHTQGDGSLRFADIVMNLRGREVRRAERLIELTTKEFELLRYLLEHPREVLSREHILQNVWGEDFVGESNIIEVYIRYLRMKIERDDEKKLIHTVRGVGYSLRD